MKKFAVLLIPFLILISSSAVFAGPDEWGDEPLISIPQTPIVFALEK